MGSYRCSCPTGYQVNEPTEQSGIRFCGDIDECARKTHTCYDDEGCSNTNGSFICNCPLGFSGNGTFCENINECETSNPCELDANSVCKDQEGYFSCECKDGFELTNNYCTNINECERNMTMCKENQECIDVSGSFVCR